MARERSSARKEASMMARLAGVSSAPPTPWKTRAAISAEAEGANPQAIEASMNQTTPIRKIRRRPNRSPNEPPRRRKAARVSEYPVTTHCRAPSEAWNERLMGGRAMPTTVASMAATPLPSTAAA